MVTPPGTDRPNTPGGQTTAAFGKTTRITVALDRIWAAHYAGDIWIEFVVNNLQSRWPKQNSIRIDNGTPRTIDGVSHTLNLSDDAVIEINVKGFDDEHHSDLEPLFEAKYRNDTRKCPQWRGRAILR